MDEPTTALDVVTQREILEELTGCASSSGFAILFITHDLSLLIEIADSIAVMYAGRLVERARAAALFRAPRHPYSLGLLSSFPAMHGPRRHMTGIPGSPPDLRALPAGCVFHPRCPFVQDRCRTDVPPLFELAGGQAAASRLLAAGRHRARAGRAGGASAAGRPGRHGRPAGNRGSGRDQPAEPVMTGNRDDAAAAGQRHAAARGAQPDQVLPRAPGLAGRPRPAARARIRRPGRGAVVHALEDVSITLPGARVTAVVGESGSGKSTLARVLARLLPPTSGELLLDGQQLPASGSGRRAYTRQVQLVLQDPFSSLNPVHDVRYHLAGRCASTAWGTARPGSTSRSTACWSECR